MAGLVLTGSSQDQFAVFAVRSGGCRQSIAGHVPLPAWGRGLGREGVSPSRSRRMLEKEDYISLCRLHSTGASKMLNVLMAAFQISPKCTPAFTVRRSRPWFSHLLAAGILAFCGHLAGCGSTPEPGLGSMARNQHQGSQTSPSGESFSHPVVAVAHSMIGTPYRYGGTTPAGFDCSGLVYYAYREIGVSAPRTTGEQMRLSRPVRLSEARPGDLLFFRLSGQKVSHVAIYAGDGKFIHAPSKGKRVSYGMTANPYWRSRLIGVGRL